MGRLGVLMVDEKLGGRLGECGEWMVRGEEGEREREGLGFSLTDLSRRRVLVEWDSEAIGDEALRESPQLDTY
jgi:hypothetical protein